MLESRVHMHVSFPQDLEMLKSMLRGTLGTGYALLEQWRVSETGQVLDPGLKFNKVVISLLFGILTVVRAR